MEFSLSYCPLIKFLLYFQESHPFIAFFSLFKTGQVTPGQNPVTISNFLARSCMGGGGVWHSSPFMMALVHLGLAITRCRPKASVANIKSS